MPCCNVIHKHIYEWNDFDASPVVVVDAKHRPISIICCFFLCCSFKRQPNYCVSFKVLIRELCLSKRISDVETHFIFFGICRYVNTTNEKTKLMGFSGIVRYLSIGHTVNHHDIEGGSN